MDVNQKIDELIEIVDSARAMPMSASCVVNRAQVLDLLNEMKQSLPDVLAQAQRVLDDRDAVIEDGRREAGRIVAAARDERGSMVSSTEVAREAQTESGRMRDSAMEEAARIRAEADEYVDQKLANFEVVLTKTLQAVGRGRDKMRGTNAMEELGRHVQEQDAVDAERAYDRFDDDFERAEQEPAAPFEERQFEDTGVYHRIAEEPYPQHNGYEEAYQESSPRGYGQPEPYADGQRGYDSGSFNRPEYPDPVLTGAHQGGYEYQNGYQAPAGEYGEAAEYHQNGYPAANEYGARGYGQPAAAEPDRNSEYPADATSYFDTGLIDVRQFRDSYGR